LNDTLPGCLGQILQIFWTCTPDICMGIPSACPRTCVSSYRSGTGTMGMYAPI